MENMFEGAYYGKPFRTRDDNMVFFSHIYGEYAVLMYPQKNITEHNFDRVCSLLVSLDGTWHPKKYKSPYDVVSEWIKEINEEALDEMAGKYASSLPYQEIDGAIKDFKTGFRKGLNYEKNQ